VLPHARGAADASGGHDHRAGLAFDIRGADHTLLWLRERRVLLAADAVEDPITFVAEPDRIAAHLRELDRLEALDPQVVLPAHGDPEAIAAGGYSVCIIEAVHEENLRAVGSAASTA
jgi:cyclase